MSDSTQDQLRQAFELIKARQRKEAIDLLLPILRTDEDNVNAWWLLANALNKPDDVREALQNVLRLRPDHDKAQQMLDKLNALHPPAPAPEPEPEPAADTFDFNDAAEEPAEDLADVVTGTPAATPDADPFGQPQTFGAPSTPPASGGDDPFGQPQTFGAPSQASAVEDPFGSAAGSAPAGQAQPRKPRPAPTATAADEDPFGGAVGAPAGKAKAPAGKRGGTNPLVIILAVIGVLALCGCIACYLVGRAGLFGLQIFGNAMGVSLEAMSQTLEAGGVPFEGVMQTLEAGAPGMSATLEAYGVDISFAGDNSALPADAVSKGQINYGDTRHENLASGEQQAYTFNGNAGDQVLISMTADDTNQLDTFLALYGPENRQIASNDDVGGSYNSLLDFQLPSNGTYTILARAFGSGSGGYTLQLQRH